MNLTVQIHNPAPSVKNYINSIENLHRMLNLTVPNPVEEHARAFHVREALENDGKCSLSSLPEKGRQLKCLIELMPELGEKKYLVGCLIQDIVSEVVRIIARTKIMAGLSESFIYAEIYLKDPGDKLLFRFTDVIGGVCHYSVVYSERLLKRPIYESWFTWSKGDIGEKKIAEISLGAVDRDNFPKNYHALMENFKLFF